eukprot:2194808-Prymnesium_polylepis.1
MGPAAGRAERRGRAGAGRHGASCACAADNINKGDTHAACLLYMKDVHVASSYSPHTPRRSFRHKRKEGLTQPQQHRIRQHERPETLRHTGIQRGHMTPTRAHNSYHGTTNRYLLHMHNALRASNPTQTHSRHACAHTHGNAHKRDGI